MGLLFRRFIADQSGVAAIEYGLIAGLIAVLPQSVWLERMFPPNSRP
jgi:Flp/Fap pilin component